MPFVVKADEVKSQVQRSMPLTGVNGLIKLDIWDMVDN